MDLYLSRQYKLKITEEANKAFYLFIYLFTFWSLEGCSLSRCVIPLSLSSLELISQSITHLAHIHNLKHILKTIIFNS